MNSLLGLVAASLTLLSLQSQALDVSLMPSNEGTGAALTLNGELGPGDGDTIKKYLKPRAEAGERTAILLTSPGGALEILPEISNAIIEMSNLLYKNHHVSNILVINEECTSACTVLTAQLTKLRKPEALEILVDQNAPFGFHGPKGGKLREEKQINAYKAAGVNPTWLSKIKPKLHTNNITSIKAKRLCEERTNIIPADSCWTNSNKDLVTVVQDRLGIVYFDDQGSEDSN